MMIISFAWTTDSFLANRKDVTRRTWTPVYARRFKEGDLCKAYDKQPRFGGKQIGVITVLRDPYWEHISLMPDSDFECEGFAYMAEKGLKIWRKEPRDAFEEWRHQDAYFWVLRFEKNSY